MKTDDLEIGIIGGTGGIGKWFADFFRTEGYPVHISGRNTGMESPVLARRCAVVIVSVPIGATCDTIRRVGPHMKKEALLMDLTSLKTEPVRVMLESSKSEVIGLHPLFGPDVPSLAGQNIIICPGRGKKWHPWIKEILQKRGAALQESTPEKHDRMMAYVQGLTHISTILMGAVLREAGMDGKEWEKYSTPVFRARMAMVEKVFKINPRLYAEIVALNPENKKILRQCEELLAEIQARVGREGAKGLREWLEA
jgi:prephenate dehydrogenase